MLEAEIRNVAADTLGRLVGVGPLALRDDGRPVESMARLEDARSTA
jgi:hypothetical protein